MSECAQSKKRNVRGPSSMFIQLLHKDAQTQDYSSTVLQVPAADLWQMSHLKSLGPSAVDVEIRMLSVDDDLEALLCFFSHELPKGENYELLQV